MIRYFQEDTSFKLHSKLVLKKWVKTIIENHNGRCGDINFIFCSDPYLLDINRRFLGHDYYTDIITFDYCEGVIVSGDLYISIDTIIANAQEYEETFEDELHRVMIHGVLHLLGYDDHEDEDILKMRNGENDSLQLLKQMLSN